MFNRNTRIITREEIDRAWHNKMSSSHLVSKVKERSKYKNKYHKANLMGEKLINMM